MEDRKLVKKIEKYFKRTSCDCEKCKDMCRRTPCIGSPAWAKDAIKKYGAGKFAITSDAALDVIDLVRGEIFLVAPLMEYNGCSFLDKDGMCTIHDDQPEEGRYSYHKPPEEVEALWIAGEHMAIIPSFPEVASRTSWCDKENKDDIVECFMLMGKKKLEADTMFEWNTGVKFNFKIE